MASSFLYSLVDKPDVLSPLQSLARTASLVLAFTAIAVLDHWRGWLFGTFLALSANDVVYSNTIATRAVLQIAALVVVCIDTVFAAVISVAVVLLFTFLQTARAQQNDELAFSEAMRDL